MGKTWILVANRGGARLFENRGPGKGVELLEDVDFPAGKMRNQDIDSDRPGRYADGRGDGNRHGYSSAQDAREHISQIFARQLSQVLDSGRHQHRYEKLILVAEPRFLGNLRQQLTPQTAAMVRASVNKDLGAIEARDLPRHLDNVLL